MTLYSNNEGTNYETTVYSQEFPLMQISMTQDLIFEHP